MLDETGQAGAEITKEMIVAGREAILRELTHPERDDIGIYKAADVAEAVFRSMSLVAAQQRPAERHERAVKLDEAV